MYLQVQETKPPMINFFFQEGKYCLNMLKFGLVLILNEFNLFYF